MDVVELVPSHADVDPCVRPGLVDHIARGAHVGEVVLLVLHHLHDADFSGRIVLVENWVMLCTADVAQLCSATWLSHHWVYGGENWAEEKGGNDCNHNHGRIVGSIWSYKDVLEQVINRIPLVKYFWHTFHGKHIF